MEHSHVDSAEEAGDGTDHQDDANVGNNRSSAAHNNGSRNWASENFLVADSTAANDGRSDECSDDAPDDAEHNREPAEILAHSVTVAVVVDHEGGSEDEESGNEPSTDLRQGQWDSVELISRVHFWQGLACDQAAEGNTESHCEQVHVCCTEHVKEEGSYCIIVEVVAVYAEVNQQVVVGIPEDLVHRGKLNNLGQVDSAHYCTHDGHARNNW